MSFNKLNPNTEKLLFQILEEDNPTEFLNNKFKSISSKEKIKLRAILCELIENDYLSITWADNVPYYVSISNKSFNYKENFLKYNEKEVSNYNIKIGDNNKISKSIIAGKVINNPKNENNGFYDKHPVFCSVLISFIIGLVLLFSFWKKVIYLIEGWF